MVGPDSRDVNVHFAVIVEVPNRATLTVDLQSKSRPSGHVRKGSVLIVVIEHWIGFSGQMTRPVHGINQQNVLPAVVVVVEKADAAAHGFWQVLLSERSRVVFEMDAGLCCHIGELDWSRRPGRDCADGCCGGWLRYRRGSRCGRAGGCLL